MPLLEMKSKLSQINTNFGSDTTTAGNTDNFPYESLNDWPPLNNAFITSSPPSTIEFDWLARQTPISDYLSGYSLQIPTGDYNAVQLQQFGIGGGIPPVYVTLTQPLTASTPKLPYNPDMAARSGPSKLLPLHIDGREANFGFTNYVSWNKLDDYYSKLKKDSGTLGIRNDGSNTVIGFEQPFVVRDIGNRWGLDPINFGQSDFGIINTAGNVVETLVNSAFSLIDDVGGAVYGRSPNDYMGHALGEVQRVGKFLLTPQGIAFLTKQKVLMARNKQQYKTSVKYGLAPHTLSGPAGNETNIQFIGDLENPRLYNMLSLAALPGLSSVARLSINKMDPGLVVQPYFDSIAEVVSQRVINLATHVKDQIIEKFTEGLGSLKVNLKKSVLSKIKIPQGITQGISELKETSLVIDRMRTSFDEFVSDVKDLASKKTALKIHPFSKELARSGESDLVNLIPYGKDKYEAEGINASHANLDFIPFKFVDVYKNEPIVFRAILSGITDTFTPEYASERYVGRPDSVYVYQGTNREIGFTFDVYPKSDEELITLWEKLNYLAGLTYPHWASAAGGGMGMIAPFCKLTIGQMYADSPGYISALTYTVQDSGTWETTFAKLPKYIQVSCTFVYIGDRLPSATQKHYELPWVGDTQYSSDKLTTFLGRNEDGSFKLNESVGTNLLGTTSQGRFLMSSFIGKG